MNTLYISPIQQIGSQYMHILILRKDLSEEWVDDM